MLVLSFLATLLGTLYVSTFSANATLKRNDTFAAGNTVTFEPIFEVSSEIQAIYNSKRSEILKKEFDAKVVKVEAVLKKYNSPFQGLGHIIVEQADACNGDWKIILAIAGNESGFGKLPVKLYNPFGYLDGVQYSSWEDALTSISCKISQRFIEPCNKSLTCIVKTYAGDVDDRQRWVYNINWFINSFDKF